MLKIMCGADVAHIEGEPRRVLDIERPIGTVMAVHLLPGPHFRECNKKGELLS